MKVLALGAVALLILCGNAHAFTYDGHSSSFNADGSTKFTDPDDQLTDGTAKKKSSKSGFSVHFSGGQTNAPGFGAQSPFLPSANRAFNSPFSQNNFGGPSNNN
jgi:hypothetical protein